MSLLPELWCGPCATTSLVVPNVRHVGRPDRGKVAVEVVRPCCRRSQVELMDASWFDTLASAVETNFDVEFEVERFRMDLADAGAAAADVIGEGADRG